MHLFIEQNDPTLNILYTVAEPRACFKKINFSLHYHSVVFTTQVYVMPWSKEIHEDLLGKVIDAHQAGKSFFVFICNCMFVECYVGGTKDP